MISAIQLLVCLSALSSGFHLRAQQRKVSIAFNAKKIQNSEEDFDVQFDMEVKQKLNNRFPASASEG